MVEGTSPESRVDSNGSNGHGFSMITLCYGEIVDSLGLISAHKLVLFFLSSVRTVIGLSRVVLAAHSLAEKISYQILMSSSPLVYVLLGNSCFLSAKRE